MHTGYPLCRDLKPKTLCIKLRQYHSGRFEELYHEHVPAHRLGQKRRIEMMKAMVLRFSQCAPCQVVRSYLNDKGNEPPADDRFQIVVAYPEQGVLRTHCGTNVQVWCDSVISPASFRTASKAS